MAYLILLPWQYFASRSSLAGSAMVTNSSLSHSENSRQIDTKSIIPMFATHYIPLDEKNLFISPWLRHNLAYDDCVIPVLERQGLRDIGRVGQSAVIENGIGSVIKSSLSCS